MKKLTILSLCLILSGMMLMMVACAKQEDSSTETKDSSVSENSDEDSTTPYNLAIILESGNDNTSNTSISVSLSAEDNVGVTGYFLSESSTSPSLSDQNWISVTTASSFSTTTNFEISQTPGIKQVNAWFRDYAGNISEGVSDNIELFETNAPIISSFVINNDNDNTSSLDVTLNVQASDDTGITAWFASESSTTPSVSQAWNKISSKLNIITTFQFSLGGNGNRKVYLWLMDRAGNISSSANDSITKYTKITGTITDESGSSTGDYKIVLTKSDHIGPNDTASTIISSAGSYTISGQFVPGNYYIIAYRDVDADGSYDRTTGALEPSEVYSYNPTYISAAGLSGADITIKSRTITGTVTNAPSGWGVVIDGYSDVGSGDNSSKFSDADMNRYTLASDGSYTATVYRSGKYKVRITESTNNVQEIYYDSNPIDLRGNLTSVTGIDLNYQ